MVVLSVLCGVLMIIAGFSCMFTPLATFLSTGYFLAIMMLVYGIVEIVRFFQKQAGVLELIVGILGVIVGLVCIFKPGSQLVFDTMLLYFIAAWIVIQGIVTLVLSIKTREERSGWIFGVIMGILAIIVGIYSFAHPALTAVTAGVLIGIYFIEAGINMIVIGAAIGDTHDVM